MLQPIWMKDEDGRVFNLTYAMQQIIEDTQENAPSSELPSPRLKELYENEKDRIVWIDDIIDFQTLEVVKAIIKYNKEDRGIEPEKRKPIKIFLDTDGGEVTVMWSIIKAIKISKTPVWTINIRSAMSAGSHILAAGHKRFAMPGSTVLIHSGSCGYSGNQEQVEKAKKYYDKLDESAMDQLLADTKIDKKELKKKAPFDWYLTDVEALEKGVVDEIISDLDVLYEE